MWLIRKQDIRENDFVQFVVVAITLLILLSLTKDTHSVEAYKN